MSTLAKVKAFQKRERDVKPFYVCSAGRIYELRAREVLVPDSKNTVVVACFAKYRKAQDIANMMNAAVATWRDPL